MVSRGLFARNTIFQYGLQIAKYLFPFITIPYLTRVLGPDIYAVRAYILAAMVFMQVFLDYGFNSYGTRAIALAADNKEGLRVETTSIMAARLVLCVAGVMVLVPVTVAIPIMAAYPLYVAIAYVCVCFKALLPDFVFTGLEDMGIITYRFVASQAVSVALIVAFVKGPEELLMVPAFEALAAFIAFVWSWENVLVKRGITPIRVSLAKVWLVFRSSTVFFVSNASTTIFTCLTTLMIGVYITDPAEISYWALAMTGVAAIQSLFTPITNSLYPHMVKRRDFALFKKLLVAGMVAVTAGVVVYALLSDVVMLVLGGEEYLAGSYVVAMTSPVILFSFPAMLMGFPVLAAVGREKQLTASSVISAFFHIAGLFVLVVVGSFTVPAIAVLRCCTEFVLLAMRTLFVIPVIKEGRLGE